MQDTPGAFTSAVQSEEKKVGGGGLEMVEGDDARGVTSRKADKQQQTLRFVASLEALPSIWPTPVTMRSLLSTNDKHAKAAQGKQSGTRVSLFKMQKQNNHSR